MYKNKIICVVIPAHNESKQIGKVLESIPDYIDKIVIIDDKSEDNTLDIIKAYQTKNDKIIFIQHEINQGCGGALASGYKWAKENNIDIAVRIDGDGQMHPKDLPNLLDAIIDNNADYAKGNRFVTGKAYETMPKIRFFGNAFLSLLTKIVSGYWHISDFQSGYTAINKKALNAIDWDKMYKRYGQPNDLLVRLNIYDFKVADIPVEPIYNIGEKSEIKIQKVIFTISWLLFKLFFWRMKEKYIIRDFHPLVFFYSFGGFFSLTTIILFIRVLYYWIRLGHIPPINALAAFFSFMSASLFILFAMWFDMQANKDLKP